MPVKQYPSTSGKSVEFILNPNTSYAFMIENKSGGTDLFGMQLFLNEEA